MTSHEYAGRLRELVAALEAAPAFNLPGHYDVGLQTKWGIETFRYYSHKEGFLAAVKAIGPGRKTVDDDDLVFITVNGLLHISANRSSVCRLVKPAVPAIYDCEPLLSQAEEAEIGTAEGR